MKKLVFILLFCITLMSQVWSIKPERIYYANPGDYGLEYTEKKLTTKDKISVNIWHIPHRKEVEAKNISVIISNPGYQNMATWFIIAINYVARGYDVYMYDYRGFGGSDDFNILTNNLYHTEFLYDLEAVADYAVQDNKQNKICLLGMEMGSIIAMNYLQKPQHKIDFYIGEAHIYSPQTYAKESLRRGQILRLPDDALDYSESYKNLNIPVLLYHNNDDYTTTTEQVELMKADIKNISIHECNTTPMNCFYNSPLVYIKAANLFLSGKAD